MRVNVNQELCMGHTLCSVVGPDVFDLDERGHCRPLHTEIPAELEAQAMQGAEACPERAIAIDR